MSRFFKKTPQERSPAAFELKRFGIELFTGKIELIRLVEQRVDLLLVGKAPRSAEKAQQAILIQFVLAMTNGLKQIVRPRPSRARGDLLKAVLIQQLVALNGAAAA